MKIKSPFTISTILIILVSVLLLCYCGCGTIKHSTKSSDSHIINEVNADTAIDYRLSLFEEGFNNGFYVPKTKAAVQSAPAIVKNKFKGKKRVELNGQVLERQGSVNLLILTQADFNKANTIYVIKKEFNLQGNRITVPNNCVLLFEGGSLNNGLIYGDNTYIEYEGTVFNEISVGGTWKVPTVYSSMFGDAKTKVNRLKDVIALTNPDIENTVYIEKGNYSLEATKVGDHLLPLVSNTTIVLDGTVSVIRNSFPRYRVFSIFDANNVTLKGSGTIVGDRDEHDYVPETPDPESPRGLNSSHEFGHGVEIGNSNNVTISDIRITKCVGDGVRIIGTDVVCKHLTIDHCRRQGISVHGERIQIDSCVISNIWGVNKAGFGIDVEPDEYAAYVNINGCTISSCNGGINCQAYSVGKVKYVRIHDCQLSTFSQDNIDKHEQYRALMCFNAYDVEVSNCTLEDSHPLMYIEGGENIYIRHNQLITNGSQFGINMRGSRGTIFVDGNTITMYDGSSISSKGIAIVNLHNAVVTNNVIHSGNLSYSWDTPCKNVVLRDNTIDAKWEPGVDVSDCKVENNIINRNVVLDNVVGSTVERNTIQSIKVKQSKNSSIKLNAAAKQ